MNLMPFDNSVIDQTNVANIYRYGSHVYGTNHEYSDEDFIVITNFFMIPSSDINYQVYTTGQFQALIYSHDISALECLFLSEDMKLKEEVTFSFTLDKEKLRTSISTISSNSWVKGKKKLIVTADYDSYIGIKSVFHSIRILDFGIQIAMHGRIVDYGSMNFVFNDLMNMAKNDSSITLWEAIETKYKKLFNAKSSEFKALCPKNLDEKTLKVNLKNIISKYDVKDSEGLLDEILMTIKK